MAAKASFLPSADDVQRLMAKHPDRIPLYVSNPYASAESKRKFLIPGDLSFGEFVASYRSKYWTAASKTDQTKTASAKSAQAYFYFDESGRTLLPMHYTMGQLYKEFKSAKTGLLHICVQEESAFGASSFVRPMYLQPMTQSVFSPSAVTGTSASASTSVSTSVSTSTSTSTSTSSKASKGSEQMSTVGTGGAFLVKHRNNRVTPSVAAAPLADASSFTSSSSSFKTAPSLTTWFAASSAASSAKSTSSVAQGGGGGSKQKQMMVDDAVTQSTDPSWTKGAWQEDGKAQYVYHYVVATAKRMTLQPFIDQINLHALASDNQVTTMLDQDALYRLIVYHEEDRASLSSDVLQGILDQVLLPPFVVGYASEVQLPFPSTTLMLKTTMTAAATTSDTSTSTAAHASSFSVSSSFSFSTPASRPLYVYFLT
jgi:hypothetical protein